MKKKILCTVLSLLFILPLLYSCTDEHGDEETTSTNVRITLDKTVYSASDSVVVTIKNDSSSAISYGGKISILESEFDSSHGHAHWNTVSWKSGVRFPVETTTLEAGEEASQTINLSSLSKTLSAGSYKIQKTLSNGEVCEAILIIQ